MLTQWYDSKSRSPEEVAALVREVSDDLVRYAFCLVGEINAAEEIALKAIADFVYRNAYRTLPSSYMWRTAYSRSVDYLRRKRNEVSLAGLEEVLASAQTVEEEAEQAERRRLLYRALGAIATDYRNVLYLHYLENISIEETAKIMGKNTKQVYNLLSRGKVALKDWFDKEGIHYEDL